MKVLTYNIHKGMDSSNNSTLTEIATYLKQGEYDVICLQEVLYHQFKKIKSILKINGVFVANVNKPLMLYGVCIFSKYEIQDSTHILLTSKKEQRGLLSINLSINEENLYVINTHLGLDKHERYMQISEILDFINRLSGKIIICGDFNEKNICLNSFIDCAIACNKYDIATFAKSKARIDYIFANRELNIKNYYVDNIMLSDHYPVICIL